MKPPSRINSPSIDIEAFFNGLSWDDVAEVEMNLAALAGGIGHLNEAILNHMVVPETVDFKLLTRSLQDSDPMFKICGILEKFITTHSGDALRFKEVAADLGLLREVLAGLVKYASDEAGEKARSSAFEIYLKLLPKIHSRFVVTKDALLRWKASVMLEQQVDFVARLLEEKEDIAESGAMLAWGNDYLSAISSGGTKGKEEGAGSREIMPLLADLKSHYLELLQPEIKREVEYHEDTIVLTPARQGYAFSGFSRLIFQAKKEAAQGATFRLTLDFEAVPMAASEGEQSGYELQLMSVATTEDLVNEGSSLVIVALVGIDLHIRIFNASGKMVVDKPDSELLSGQEQTDLKALLDSAPFPDVSTLSREQTEQIIKGATSSADYTPPKGPPVPVQPTHLRRTFQTSYVQMGEIRKLIDGFVTSLQEEVNSGVFKDQDSQSLTGWFTDSVVPWVQTDDVKLIK